jgi:hypothetical protein
MIIRLNGIDLIKESSIFMGISKHRSGLIEYIILEGQLPERLTPDEYIDFENRLIRDLIGSRELLDDYGHELPYVIEWMVCGGVVENFFDVLSSSWVGVRVLTFRTIEYRNQYRAMRDGGSKYNERKLAMEIKAGRWRRPGRAGL